MNLWVSAHSVRTAASSRTVLKCQIGLRRSRFDLSQTTESTFKGDKRTLDNETDREALAAVAEKKVENHNSQFLIILQYLTNINMNDKIEFNEEFDTYIAFFEHQASLQVASDLLDDIFNSAKFTNLIMMKAFNEGLDHYEGPNEWFSVAANDSVMMKMNLMHNLLSNSRRAMHHFN